MASLEAENRSGLAFRVCLKMNTNSRCLLKGGGGWGAPAKSSSGMIEKAGRARMVCVCVCDDSLTF